MKIHKVFTVLGIALSTAGFSNSALAALVAGDSLYVDFGKNDTTNGIIMPSNATMNTAAGNSTGVADSFGHYWNNAWTNFSGAGGTTPPTVPNLVNASNVGTGVGLSFSSGWQANGFQNGGLTTPSSSLLGDFASGNATGDYYFFTTDTVGVTASMTFTGLNPTLTYDFKIFATRNTTEVRRTLYSITDLNGVHTYNLETSGPGIGDSGYNGNNNTFATFTSIVPDASGNIKITLTTPTNNFAYIGAAEITAVPVPEPSTFGMILAAGCISAIIIRVRQRAQETSAS